MIRFSTWLTPEAGGKVDREHSGKRRPTAGRVDDGEVSGSHHEAPRCGRYTRIAVLGSMTKKMNQVKISPKFQVAIPENVRVFLGLEAGQKLQILSYGDRIELVPVRKINEMRGFLKGMDIHFEREPDRAM